MTTKAKKPRKTRAKPLKQAPEPAVKAEPQERVLDQIADNAQQLKAILVVLDRIAGTIPTDSYMSDWDAEDFTSLVTVARERAEVLAVLAER